MWYGTGTPRWVVRPQPLQVVPFVGFCVRVSIILFDRYMSSELDRLIGDTPLFSGVPFIFMFTDMDILYRYVIPVLGIVNAFTKGFCMGKDGYSSLLPRFSLSILGGCFVGEILSRTPRLFSFPKMMISKRFKVIGSSGRGISPSSRSPSDVV